MKKYIVFLLWLTGVVLQAQTKVSGTVKDTDGFPIAFANVLFPGSTIGTITNDDGSFYIESDQAQTQLSISFIGFETVTLLLEKQSNYDLKIVLEAAAEQLQSVTLVSGKQSKKTILPLIFCEKFGPKSAVMDWVNTSNTPMISMRK